MTLRVGIDMGRFPASGTGGLQVYSRSLVEAIARSGEDIEVFLYGDGVTPPAGAAGRFHLRPSGGSRLSRAPFLYRQVFLPRAAAADGLDVMHFPFNGGSLSIPVPAVVSVHDLICLLAPGLGTSHLTRPYFHLRRAYHRLAIPASIRRASVVLASSEATRSDIVRLLGLPEERIRVVPLAASPAYEKPPAPGEIAGWRRRAGIEEPYILGFASLDPRKNAARLIGAFARTDPAIRRSVLLVIVCTQPHPRRRLAALAAGRGVADRVRFLPFQDELDLRCLYARALCLAFPSLYEGFGLPVLEAFSSGTPVLTSRAGSLAEVAGDAAEYVDPLDEDSIASGLIRLATDGTLRADLVAKGNARAALFRWEETARRTIEAYRDAARGGGREHR